MQGCDVCGIDAVLSTTAFAFLSRVQFPETSDVTPPTKVFSQIIEVYFLLVSRV